MIKPQEPDTKTKLLNRLVSFLQRNRKPIIIIAVAVVILVVGLFVYIEVQNNRAEAAATLAEEVQDDFSTWQQAEEDAQASVEEELFATIDEVLDRYPRTYGASRVLSVRGNLYWEKEEFEDAAADFEALANRFPKSHLAPVALTNAAAAYEEVGDLETAQALLERLVDRYAAQNEPEVPHALFALGRLAELDEDFEAAAARYDTLIDDFAASNWTHLARNRIIHLRTENLIEG